MKCIYGLFRKSCKTLTSYVPVKASGAHKIFEAPIYLQHVKSYRKTVQAQVRYTLSRAHHISSLFQHKDGPWSYGDMLADNSAILMLLDGSQMEVFVFPDQRALAQTFYMNVDKLPLHEIRSSARSVLNPKYDKQLTCYQGQQLAFIK